MSPALRMFVLGAVVDWPDHIEAEIDFHRLALDTQDLPTVVRNLTAGNPFALAAHGPGIAPALHLAQDLLPANRAMHLILSGQPTDELPHPPIPVTYLATDTVPPALAGWRPLTIRPLPPNNPTQAAIYAIREQLGTMDPGHYVWP